MRYRIYYLTFAHINKYATLKLFSRKSLLILALMVGAVFLNLPSIQSNAPLY